MRYDSSLICLFTEPLGYFTSVSPTGIRSLCEVLLDFRVKQTSQYKTDTNFFQHCRFYPLSMSQNLDDNCCALQASQKARNICICHTRHLHILSNLTFQLFQATAAICLKLSLFFLWAEFIPVVRHLLCTKVICTDKCCISADPHQLSKSW